MIIVSVTTQELFLQLTRGDNIEQGFCVHKFFDKIIACKKQISFSDSCLIFHQNDT